jgi:membrane protease YdiL (CAAX protease family)
MSTLAAALPHRSAAASLGRAVVIAGLLTLVVETRATAALDGRIDGLVIGALFGVALIAVALGARGWPAIAGPSRRPRASAITALGVPIGLGLAGGATLVGLALAVRWPGPWIPLRPAASLAPWAVVTVVVATAEELVLRGTLFDALDEGLGLAAAIGGTTIAFALIHVPLYGWHVVPLDLGVGLVLAGLRLLSGGVVAPAIAHALADLATWWL